MFKVFSGKAYGKQDAFKDLEDKLNSSNVTSVQGIAVHTLDDTSFEVIALVTLPSPAKKEK